MDCARVQRDLPGPAELAVADDAARPGPVEIPGVEPKASPTRRPLTASRPMSVSQVAATDRARTTRRRHERGDLGRRSRDMASAGQSRRRAPAAGSGSSVAGSMARMCRAKPRTTHSRMPATMRGVPPAGASPRPRQLTVIRVARAASRNPAKPRAAALVPAELETDSAAHRTGSPRRHCGRRSCRAPRPGAGELAQRGDVDLGVDRGHLRRCGGAGAGRSRGAPPQPQQLAGHGVAEPVRGDRTQDPPACRRA